MQRQVVAISRTLAAGGEQTGQNVAKELGFRYVDDEIVVRAAAAAGVSPETVAQIERNEPLITRILAGMVTAPPAPAVWSPELTFLASHSRLFERVVEDVIRQTAAEGKVVIVAHGASVPLAGRSDLLRILVTASPEERAARLAGEAKLSVSEAKRAIEDSDRHRGDFLRRFYNVRAELPTHYDLVVNTDVLSMADATRVIIAAAQS